MSKRYTIPVAKGKKPLPIRGPARRKIIQEKYRINELFVAEDPVYEVIYDDKYFEAIISYAEYRGLWAYGENHGYKGTGVGCGGGGSLPSFSSIRKEPTPFSSKEQARTEAIKSVLEYFVKRGDHPYGKSAKPVIDALNKALSPQLTLF